jgi:hypothetical protein
MDYGRFPNEYANLLGKGVHVHFSHSNVPVERAGVLWQYWIDDKGNDVLNIIFYGDEPFVTKRKVSIVGAVMDGDSSVRVDRENKLHICFKQNYFWGKKLTKSSNPEDFDEMLALVDTLPEQTPIYPSRYL